MKKSTKIVAAAAGALLLTGGLTAAANGGTIPVASAPVAAPVAAPAALTAVDIQPVPETVVAQNRITVGASAAAVSAALAKCQADKLPFVTVALVDRFGTVQALLRGDNAGEHTIEAARQKAYTAAAFGTSTSELTKRINGNGPSIADLPGTLFLAGGVPTEGQRCFCGRDRRGRRSGRDAGRSLRRRGRRGNRRCPRRNRQVGARQPLHHPPG